MKEFYKIVFDESNEYIQRTRQYGEKYLVQKLPTCAYTTKLLGNFKLSLQYVWRKPIILNIPYIGYVSRPY